MTLSPQARGLHGGTFTVNHGRQLIEHTPGTFRNDPAGDNCPLCLDPVRGCPFNARSLDQCRSHRQEAYELAKSYPNPEASEASMLAIECVVCPAHETDGFGPPPSAAYKASLADAPRQPDDAITIALRRIEVEVRQAASVQPPLNSPHEGWAVIAEELDELWDHVRANTGRGPAARAEAVQVGAMAVRYITDLIRG